jgi:Mn2+/Fe2+ NRAMP family transporter
MTKLFEIALGIATSIGGFLEAGSLSTAVQAGAKFRFQLIWAIVLGTVCLSFLVEMSGRFAAVSKHTIADAIRERFGFSFFLIPLLATLAVNLMVLSAEIGGVSYALQLVTNISFQVWAGPVAIALWLFLFLGTFALIEKGFSLLGLITLCFVVATVLLHPPWSEVARGIVPSLPEDNQSQYWFIAVAILGASISPYLFLFYSSGAVEDKWDESDLAANRVTAGFGISFGGVVAVSALVVATLVFHDRGLMEVASFDQIGLILTPVFGFWGFVLLAASLGIACFGAALEVALEQGYLLAQGLGWNWGKDLKPADDPGFTLTYTVAIVFAAVPMIAGLDPLKLTIFSMALTAMSLPLAVVPFLFLMNDKRYVGEHTNGWISNLAVLLIIALGFVLAVVSLPLQIFGG